MNNSNQTLRFSRTAREEFGHDVEFDDGINLGDKLVGWAALFGWGFLVGLIVGRTFWS